MTQRRLTNKDQFHGLGAINQKIVHLKRDFGLEPDDEDDDDTTPDLCEMGLRFIRMTDGD